MLRSSYQCTASRAKWRRVNLTIVTAVAGTQMIAPHLRSKVVEGTKTHLKCAKILIFSQRRVHQFKEKKKVKLTCLSDLTIAFQNAVIAPISFHEAGSFISTKDQTQQVDLIHQHCESINSQTTQVRQLLYMAAMKTIKTCAWKILPVIILHTPQSIKTLNPLYKYLMLLSLAWDNQSTELVQVWVEPQEKDPTLKLLQ